MKLLKPPEILEVTIETSVAKADGSLRKLFVLAALAGAFIAFAAQGSTMAAFNLLAEAETFGLGRALAGAVFSTGLMLVVLAGAELFTGNTMMIAAVCEKKVKALRMIRNWCIVYAGNFAGSLLIAYMIAGSGLLGSGGGLLGAVTLNIAVYKVNLTFVSAFFLGILCNWLVCLAVWISSGADAMAGKILGIFFPIWLFVTSGFEHSVANMYYVPAGILIKGNEVFAGLSGATQGALQNLTWGGFFLRNLLPVTLGNVVGGSVFVALAYWYAYKKENATCAKRKKRV